MLKGGFREGISLERDNNKVMVSFTSMRLSKSNKKVKFSWTWQDQKKKGEILVQSGEIGIISTEDWCELHRNFVQTNLLLLQIDHDSTSTPYPFGPFNSHPLLSELTWEHQKNESDNFIKLKYKIKDEGGNLITKEESLPVDFNSDRNDLKNNIKSLIDASFADEIRLTNLEVPFYTRMWKKSFVLQFWCDNNFRYDINVYIKSELNIKQNSDINSTKLPDNSHKLSTEMIRIDTNEHFEHSWNICSKFSSLPELESYLEEFNQQDHQFILDQPTENQKFPVEITNLPEEGEEKFTKRYIRINWQSVSNDDRLFPELEYELLMSVEPNGKLILLPDILDGDIIGYKIKQNYSSLVSEINDGDLVCSIKSKFDDMKSVERYVEKFNDNWDSFFLGEPESLILDITVDCLEDEEWIRNEGYHLKNHIVYFKLIFQNTDSDFYYPKLELIYDRPSASITQFAVGKELRKYFVKYSFNNQYVILDKHPPVLKIKIPDDKNPEIETVEAMDISGWWRPTKFTEILSRYNSDRLWLTSDYLPDSAMWLKELIKNMGLEGYSNRPYHKIVRELGNQSILMPIDPFLQFSDTGRKLSKKYWFALDPITLRVFTRSKQYYDEDEEWPQPEYAYSEDEEQESSRIHYHFAEDELYEFNNGIKTLETKDSSEQGDSIRMYLLQEWMGIV